MDVTVPFKGEEYVVTNGYTQFVLKRLVDMD